MHGMAGREGVERLSGKGHAVEMADHREAVRPSLIEDRFEHMRDRADDERREQDMVGVLARASRAAAAIQPPARGQRQDHMLVGAPGQEFGSLLGASAGIFRD